jgi:tetratricopeptide (TPR) repeat protein
MRLRVPIAVAALTASAMFSARAAAEAQCGDSRQSIDEQLAVCTRALDADPGHIPTRLTLGRLLLRKGNEDPTANEDAVGILTRAYELDPKNADALALAGLAAAQLGREKTARTYLESARKLNEQSPYVYCGLSQLELKAGDAAAAEKLARQAVKLGPEVPEANLALARALAARGAVADALEATSHVARLGGDQREAGNIVAQARLSSLREDSSPEVLLAALREAERDAQAVLKKDPRNRQALETRAHAVARLARLSKSERPRAAAAAEDLCRILRDTIDDGTGYALVADLLDAAGRDDDALDALQRVALLGLKRDDAYRMLAEYLRARNRRDEALRVECTRYVVRPSPESAARLRDPLAEVLSDAGRAENFVRELPSIGSHDRMGLAAVEPVTDGTDITVTFAGPDAGRHLAVFYRQLLARGRLEALNPAVWPPDPCRQGTRTIEPALAFDKSAASVMAEVRGRITDLYLDRLRIARRSLKTADSTRETDVATLDRLLAAQAETAAAERRGAFVSPTLRWRVVPFAVRVSDPFRSRKRSEPVAARLCRDYSFSNDPKDCSVRAGKDAWYVNGQALQAYASVRADLATTRALLDQLTVEIGGRPSDTILQSVVPAKLKAELRLGLTAAVGLPASGIVEFMSKEAKECPPLSGEGEINEYVLTKAASLEGHVAAYQRVINYDATYDTAAPAEFPGVFVLDVFPNAKLETGEGSPPACPVWEAPHPDLLTVQPTEPVPTLCVKDPDALAHGVHLLGIVGAKRNSFGTVGLAASSSLRWAGGSGKLGPLAPPGTAVVSTDLTRTLDCLVPRSAYKRWVLNTSFILDDLPLRVYRQIGEKILAVADSVLIVAASSDAGIDCNALDCPYAPGGLGSKPNVITVAALDRDTSQPKLWEKSDRGRLISLAAPGWKILGPEGADCYSLSTGSSEAAAIVSAGASLLMRTVPRLFPWQTKQRLVATSRFDIDFQNKEEILGGVLDVKAALDHPEDDLVVLQDDGGAPTDLRPVGAFQAIAPIRFYKEGNACRDPLAAETCTDWDGSVRHEYMLRIHREASGLFTLAYWDPDEPKSIKVERHLQLAKKPVNTCRTFSNEDGEPCFALKSKTGARQPLLLDKVSDVYFRIPSG